MNINYVTPDTNDRLAGRNVNITNKITKDEAVSWMMKKKTDVNFSLASIDIIS